MYIESEEYFELQKNTIYIGFGELPKQGSIEGRLQKDTPSSSDSCIVDPRGIDDYRKCYNC
jgi:hypothetical protein